MNNTDILEEKEKKAIEYFENKIKNKLPLYKETYVDGKPYRINILQLETNFTEEQANKTEIILKLISNLIAENKEKDEEIENQDKTIDRLVKEQEEREKYTHQLELENKELDKFIKEGITIATNSPYKNFQLNYLRENFIQKSKVEEIIHNNKPHIAQEKLQSLLGKE